jgi:uncharacterized protein YwqG
MVSPYSNQKLKSSDNLNFILKETIMNPTIPHALERFKNDIAKTITPYLHIEPVPLLFNERLGVRDSKLGGIPYLKKLEDYPFSKTGHPMKLLAQINLDDLSEHHMHLPHFPHRGLLQFFLPFDHEEEMQRFLLLAHQARGMKNSAYEFIKDNLYRDKTHTFDPDNQSPSNNNDFTHYSCPYYHSEAIQSQPLSHTYQPYGGVDFEDFRIIYHQDFSEPSIINSQVEEISACYDNFPIFTEMRLEVDRREEYCGLEDSRNEHFYGRKVWARLSEEESEHFYGSIKNTGCKMGGYASFLQTDPHRHKYHPELLLQIDSCHCTNSNRNRDSNTNTNTDCDKVSSDKAWVDCSMIHFFIEQDDLEHDFFSNVHYHRDYY